MANFSVLVQIQLPAPSISPEEPGLCQDPTLQLPGGPGPPLHSPHLHLEYSGHLPNNLFKHVPPGVHHVHSQIPEPAYQPLSMWGKTLESCAPSWQSPPFNILGVLKVNTKLSTLKIDSHDFHAKMVDQAVQLPDGFHSPNLHHLFMLELHGLLQALAPVQQ